MKLIGKAPLLRPRRIWDCFEIDSRSLRRTNPGLHPSRAIPGIRPTPSPREPKPTPGTVALPVAPLQCRAPIYTMCGDEIPLGLRNKLKGIREGTEANA